MPALNFKKQFVPKILSREKRFTIRGKRKKPIKPGDTLMLYSGMRTKQCTEIGTAICSAVTPVKICDDAPYLFFGGMSNGIALPGKWLRFADDALKSFYSSDGFSSYEEMKTFFADQYGLPFTGELIEWKEFKPAIPEAPMMGMSY